MSKFSDPADRIVRDVKDYADARVEGLKLDTVKGLSEGTSALAAILLVIGVAAIFLLILSFAAVMLLGEAMGSYSVAAFIVAGVLGAALIVLILCRKRLFRNTFVSLFGGILKAQNEIKDKEDLEKAMEGADERIKKTENAIGASLTKAKDFYTPTRILGEGFRHGVLPIVANLLTNKRQ